MPRKEQVAVVLPKPEGNAFHLNREPNPAHHVRKMTIEPDEARGVIMVKGWLSVVSGSVPSTWTASRTVEVELPTATSVMEAVSMVWNELNHEHQRELDAAAQVAQAYSEVMAKLGVEAS